MAVTPARKCKVNKCQIETGSGLPKSSGGRVGDRRFEGTPGRIRTVNECQSARVRL